MKTIFVTGTDTGVGKTVLATLLTRFLRQRGVRVAALKPICSGDRSDALALWTAAGKVLALDDVNPWHFRAAVAPLLAARREHKQVHLADVVRHVRRVSAGFQVVVLEGAGGLLSPLGEGFDSRELLVAARAQPVIVSPNRLGAVNQVRLALEALPTRLVARAHVVLSDLAKRDIASRSNAVVLGEFVPRARLHVLPWLRAWASTPHRALQGRLRRVLERLEGGVG